MNSQSKFVINDTAWAHYISAELAEYMENCAALVFDDPAPEFTTLSGEEYCGCEVCESRETLHFLVPRILQAYKEGKVDFA